MVKEAPLVQVDELDGLGHTDGERVEEVDVGDIIYELGLAVVVTTTSSLGIRTVVSGSRLSCSLQTACALLSLPTSSQTNMYSLFFFLCPLLELRHTRAEVEHESYSRSKNAMKEKVAQNERYGSPHTKACTLAFGSLYTYETLGWIDLGRLETAGSISNLEAVCYRCLDGAVDSRDGSHRSCCAIDNSREHVRDGGRGESG